MPTTITIPDCPVCKKQMIPNTEGKQRNPKAPDWKCSDRNCKFQLDKNTGNWVVSEYITAIWDNTPVYSKNPVAGQNEPQGTSYRPTKEAIGQRREFQNTMDYKANQIASAQKAKEDSMRIYASGRDAVLVVTTLYPELSNDMNIEKEKTIQTKIKDWQKFFADQIYNDKPFV